MNENTIVLLVKEKLTPNFLDGETGNDVLLAAQKLTPASVSKLTPNFLGGETGRTQ